MRTLKSRWMRHEFNGPYGKYKYILHDNKGLAWAEVRPTSKDVKGCGWEIDMWNGTWTVVANVPTLRLARGTGRMLAALALQNF